MIFLVHFMNLYFLRPITKYSIRIILGAVPLIAIYAIVRQSKNGMENTEDASSTTVEAMAADSLGCEGRGGIATDSGLKVWCWGNLTIPEYSGKKGVTFSEGQLKVDSECDESQVTIIDGRLTFSLDVTSVPTGNWCSDKFNMRAEIRTVPWNVRHEIGTEEWFGWNYTFGDNYKFDHENPWLFFQVHPGIVGLSPQTELLIISDNQFEGHSAGEIFVANHANNNEYKSTGIAPIAGGTINVVIHAIWGDAVSGLLQVWINGVSVYNQQVATVYTDYPWGGNAKWGIYKWRWRNESGVQKSIKQGITKLRTSMGPLRILTRSPDHPRYGKKAYSSVEPQ